MHTILIAGAALVGLPILLHLIMKQEPKRLTFPAFRFLKQKLKTNQRKLRLRHFILLAMRMLLIALFCLTLYQPTFKSDRLNIRGEPGDWICAYPDDRCAGVDVHRDRRDADSPPNGSEDLVQRRVHASRRLAFRA